MGRARRCTTPATAAVAAGASSSARSCSRVVWIQFYFLQRNRPEDVGLAPIDDPATAVDESKDRRPPTAARRLTRDAWTNLVLVGGFYFFSKLIRYAIWSWAAYFLDEQLRAVGQGRELYSIAFDVCRHPRRVPHRLALRPYFGSRRARHRADHDDRHDASRPRSWSLFGERERRPCSSCCSRAVGFFLYGPDALLSGAGAMDIGSRRAADVRRRA